MALGEKSKNSVTTTSKYNVARSEKLGRYLQSAKNLTAGEVILREKPIAVGPTISSNDYVCFACLRFLPKIRKLSQYLCSKCNVAPLCGTACEGQPKYHTPDECEMFKNNKDLLSSNIVDIIGVLLPLRLWLLKQRDPVLWGQVESMESHVDKRRNTSVWKDREENVINGTSGRREHLRGGKYFECECSLCKDPYEMGSYMSCILCPRCREGYVGVKNPLTINPYEKNMRWQCNRCRRSIGGRLVRATLNISRTLIEDTDDNDIRGLETLTTKLARSFHPNHYLMLSLKQKLLAAYRKEMGTPNPQKKCMQKMLDTCKEVCDVLEIVEPGISRLKGIMLYEMHLPLVLLANRAYAARDISLTELSSRLEKAADLLKRSLRILLLEPVETPEGKLAKRALHELKALNQNITDVKTMMTTVEDTHGHRQKKVTKK
ncbi:uncharacterized protein LOC116430906 isoform X2 [Nomia melanderi]|uniref:uncharacterized protein LOC116430906 isoform X2 n=1 Tax=Nomia melanderi TaxID=2448451 RepID=UPI003FCCB1ED